MVAFQSCSFFGPPCIPIWDLRVIVWQRRLVWFIKFLYVFILLINLNITSYKLTKTKRNIYCNCMTGFLAERQYAWIHLRRPFPLVWWLFWQVCNTSIVFSCRRVKFRKNTILCKCFCAVFRPIYTFSFRSASSDVLISQPYCTTGYLAWDVRLKWDTHLHYENEWCKLFITKATLRIFYFLSIL